MKRIAFIIPYYGKFPNNFEIWCKSVEYNETIDFFIVTDIKENRIQKKNIVYIDWTFEKLKSELQKFVEFEITLETPYKLCEYKPLYGLVFSEYLLDYDFWGHCDVDLVFGDIRKYLTDQILDRYDKIYKLGHCTLYRNEEKTNFEWKKKHNKMAYRYDEAFKTNYVCHFDETGGISDFFDESRAYNVVCCADILPKYKQFRCYELQSDFVKQIFVWKEGKIYGLTYENGKITKTEYIYVHFQKRHMEICIYDIDNVTVFYMVPNRYIEDVNVELELKNQNRTYLYKEYMNTRLKEICSKIKSGAIKQRIYRIKKKRKIYEDK